ncbi:DUF1491 family protein [Ancylobacter dichloromethanicus]|uniref:DUF1491 domain-containing protein n=1 Tax=Ancylobacter dichloromethanicus TaxID=518825 RepID=A0A9W6JDZ4_9HYPH|nr:DUF1491 family protein [Ancylobacter dichloromethanicus]MBS7552507.1 DUF1491 family protein [Ancylobacter dichloromethanicus]GLK74249.1 hypothetical protein GCM10017643_43670 [Ancylobacter dichloromethanicus]
MRLKSAIFVSALLRRANGAGAFAAVRRRGAEEAGAVFVKVATQDGRAALYGPALPSLEGLPEEGVRLFTPLVPAGAPESEAEARMVREMRYDSDLWLVEIEDRAGRCFLDLSRG